MLKKLQQRQPSESRLSSVPAPTGGLNTRDPISAMSEKDALELENMFPTPSDVMLRQGFSSHLSGSVLGQVESLMAYSSPSGTERLYAASGTAIYNASAASATASVAVSGLGNARWSHTNFANAAATSFLLCVNGDDGLRSFDGTTWSTQTLTGVTASNLVHISQHQRRLWFVKDNTLQAWYLNTDAIAGTASKLDLSGFARKGGELMATASLTFDGGDGVDDYWIGVTSEGELIAYRGTDPSSSANWQMIGRWELGRPPSRRCFHKFAGDLLYLADDGVWPVSQLISAQTSPRMSLSDKIADSIRSAMQSYRSNFGWQILFWPRYTMVLVNVPVEAGNFQQQYVMNSITGAWGGPFTGIKANCFEVFQGNLYFGGNGVVNRFWDTFADAGIAITGKAKQAFNYFKSRANKQFTMARPILQTNGSPAVSFGINTDYSDADVLSALTFSPITYGTWDSGLWDSALWGLGLTVLSNWQGVSAFGFCGAPRLRVQSAGIEARWVSTDILWKPGAVL